MLIFNDNFLKLHYFQSSLLGRIHSSFLLILLFFFRRFVTNKLLTITICKLITIKTILISFLDNLIQLKSEKLILEDLIVHQDLSVEEEQLLLEGLHLEQTVAGNVLRKLKSRGNRDMVAVAHFIYYYLGKRISNILLG